MGAVLDAICERVSQIASFGAAPGTRRGKQKLLRQKGFGQLREKDSNLRPAG
jgi:hypothetical protein